MAHLQALGPRAAVLGIAVIVAACSGAGSSPPAVTTVPATQPPTTAAAATPTTVAATPTAAAATPTAAAETPVAPSAAGVTITVWGSPGWNQAEKDALTAFTTATGVQVNLELPKDSQTVLSKWSAGERPDIMFYFADAAHLVALNPDQNLQDLSNEPFVAKQLPSIAAGLKFNGKTYAALYEYPYVFGLLYNKAIFTELGIKPPTNFADVLAACQTIKSKKPTVAPVFAGGGDMWPLQHLVIEMTLDAQRDGSFIEGLNTAKTKFTDPAFVQGIQDEKQLVDQGCYNKDLLTATFEQESHTLDDGKAAMVFNNTYEVSVMLNNDGAAKVDATVGFVGISHSDNAAGYQGSAGIEAPKTGDAAREAAARQLIDYYLGAGYKTFIDAYKDFPVVTGVDAPADIPQIYKDANAAFLKDGVPIFSQNLRADYGDFPTALQQMVAGKSTPEQAAQVLQTALEKSAKAIGLPGY